MKAKEKFDYVFQVHIARGEVSSTPVNKKWLKVRNIIKIYFYSFITLESIWVQDNYNFNIIIL
jgi:hypothetical protein